MVPAQVVNFTLISARIDGKIKGFLKSDRNGRYEVNKFNISISSI